MASYPLTSGDGDGFAIHLQASKLIREVIKKAEDHFTWLEEILVETKKAFKTSEIELLPKTPSVKNKKRKGRKAASDEDTSTGGEEPPTKQRRGAKKKLAADYSPGPKVDSDAETTEEISEEKATRPKRNTRNTSRSANTTRSSRARNPRARSAKSQKDDSDEVEPETPAPVICLENSLICDTISEESEVTKKTPNKVDHKPSDEDEMEVEENIEKVEVVTEHAKTPVSKSVDTMEEETEKKGMTPVNKCTKGLNRSINHSPKPSPKAIAGFCLLNVKAKAHAYEEHYMSDDSATSTTPRGNKTKKCALKDLDNEATPKVQVIDSSPSDEGENTPNVLPSTPSTPSTVIYKSTASVTLGGNKTKARVALADREETESEKVSSTEDKFVHSTETESSEKESENEGPEEEVVVVEDETPRRVSRRHSTRRSTRMSHSKITRVSLSQRRSSVRNRASVKIIAAVKKAQEIRQQVMEEKMRGTPESSRTCTRSKLRLNKAGRQVPSTQNNSQTPTEAPLRSTRSKMRVNKPPRPDMTSSSDETDAVTSVPQPTRSTRSKMRQPPVKPTTPSTPTTEEHTEDEEEEPGTPVIQPPSSMMPTRTTRSKARQTKPHRAAELAAAAESEDESATPTCDQAGYSKPEAGPRTTRSKMRKRQITPEDTQTPPKAVPSPPKKQCLDTPDNTNWEDENSDGYVERTPSPQCPRGKIVRPKGALSASSQRTYSNMRTTIVSFIKRNTPTKVTQKEKDQQKAVAVQNKSKLIEERVKQAMDAKKMQAEERKRLREERMKRVLDKKELLEKEKLNQQHKKNNFESKANNYMKVQEKQRDEREKLKQVRDQKLKEAEERRRAEEEQRQQKQHELEEEHRRREEMMTRKKEFADQERLRKIEEERKKKEEKMAEMERERIQEQEKQMQLEEEREAERQRQKEEREKAAARERAERERAELEKQREKERVMKDQLEKDKERERQRLREEAARREEERKANREAQQISTLIQKHNSSVNNASNTSTSTASASSASKPTLNTSYTVSKETTAASRVSPQSYEITPDKKYKKSTANDYGIDELRSDDSTDDDEAPRKVVPQWAKGPCLKAALINQYYHPPCLDDIFDIILPPDLNVLFKKRRPRFNKRTSSAIWNSPILKPGQVC